MSLDIDLMRILAWNDSKAWFPELHARPDDLLIHCALGLAGETGEAVDVVKKWNRTRFDISGEQPTLDTDWLGEELADVLIYLLHLCSVAGIDITRAYEMKREANMLRFGG